MESDRIRVVNSFQIELTLLADFNRKIEIGEKSVITRATQMQLIHDYAKICNFGGFRLQLLAFWNPLNQRFLREEPSKVTFYK